MRDTVNGHRSIRSRVLDCEEPLREIGVFATAITAIALTDWQDIQGGEKSRDQAIHWLAWFIAQRAKTIDTRLSLGTLAADTAEDAVEEERA